jgi:hypothetical protein
MNLDYVKKDRGLDFIEKGMKVECYGRMGIVISGNNSGNINVKFDGEKYLSNCHPMSCIKYFDKDGKIIKSFDE